MAQEKKNVNFKSRSYIFFWKKELERFDKRVHYLIEGKANHLSKADKKLSKL